MEPTASAFPRGAWQGHWIAPEPLRQPPNPISFGGEIPPHEFSRVMYRTTFELDAAPASAPARLTADSRYVLYVNGVEIGRGPIRSQPRRLRYDEYDIAHALREGTNVIAALVTYYGTANAFWQPAAASGGIGTDALLVFEAQLGERLLVSDDSWASIRSSAWTSFGQESIDGVPVERVDARELDPDWVGVEFDASAWPAATIAATSHIGGFARSQPPTDPYGALLPRSIAALGGETIAASALTDSSLRRLESEWASAHPAARVLQVLEQGWVESTAATLPVTAVIEPGSVQHLAVDFGRVVAGYVELDVAAPAGTHFELHYREISFEADGGAILSAPHTSAQYVARGDRDEYRSLELNGLRYLHLVVHSDEPVEVTIQDIRVREYIYPRQGDAFFRSNDEEINALYTAGVRTVGLNSLDSFTDCPTREQRAWVGDGVVHQMVQFVSNSDWRLARNYVQLGDSPRPDHMLPMSVVGEIEFNAGTTIPDWALHWVHGIHNQFLYCGVDDDLLSVLPTVEKVLRWYLPYVDDFGTISDVPEWNLVDWASVFSTGRSSILTALWARGLREFADISEFLGNAGSASWARQLWDSARVGFEDFWDESRGTYVDHFVNGEKLPAASQAAGATAIVSGLAPHERWGRIVDTITDEDALVVRSWIGGVEGGYDLGKMADQARGVQTIDWDAATEIVLAEPFFSYVVHDAVAQAGQSAKLLRLMRRWSVFLVDGYDTFGECWGWGTPVHGWSSTPTRDLTNYVLGISPSAPGYTHARIAPAVGELTSVEGSVPTPFGPLSVQVTERQTRIASPVPFTFVRGEDDEVTLPAGEHVFPS